MRTSAGIGEFAWSPSLKQILKWNTNLGLLVHYEEENCAKETKKWTRHTGRRHPLRPVCLARFFVSVLCAFFLFKQSSAFDKQTRYQATALCHNKMYCDHFCECQIYPVHLTAGNAHNCMNLSLLDNVRAYPFKIFPGELWMQWFLRFVNHCRCLKFRRHKILFWSICEGQSLITHSTTF